MPDFRKALERPNLLFFDGGYGTLLQSRGLPPGVSPELFGLERPDVVRRVHEDYVDAGAMILTTNTFGGTRFKLGAGVDATALNRRMAALARDVAGDTAFVAGSVGPTGHFVKPLGPLTLRELVDAFKEQIEGLVQGGADLILAETHFDIAEAKAVVLAAREVCDLPVAVSMTFEGDACLTGSSPAVFASTMENLGVDVVGTNCSAGPEQMVETVRRLAENCTAPIQVEPNAGLPQLDEFNNTVFRMGPEAFAEASRVFVGLGAKILGGCCGTTPEHIRLLREACDALQPASRSENGPALRLTARSSLVLVGPSHPSLLVGERINPTGKKALSQELAAGKFSEALRFADEQTQAGCRVLDVNVGAAMVEEAVVLPNLVETLVSRVQTPLCIDSADADAVEAALWRYPASPLVNSISGEPGRMERLGPVVRAFGAPFILLPLVGRKLPATASERIEVIEKLVAQAEAMGVPRRLILVDVLALTVSSKPEAALHCLETIRHCRDRLGLPTVVGLSNISFGLPARELVNAAFLTMAMAAGLSAFIANPNSARMRETMAATEVLLNRDPQAANFIQGYADWKPNAGGSGPGRAAAPTSVDNLREAVVKGAKDRILSMVEAELERGADPLALVDNDLIPAIIEVGELYERKEYFLPQLLLSAETLQTAFSRLKPLLEAQPNAKKKAVVVMATVEGDIHDIGKNIVCLMLRNQGFEVTDLGKDVAADRIVDEAEKLDADIIGLSALMTTTMVRMKDTVDLVREKGLHAKILIGGAVVTEQFCESIGAHGYATDAVSAVKLATKLAKG
ncbi:MAG: homocysteine S-methyltransferase family protein [Desulfovibrionaceae bacterium]